MDRSSESGNDGGQVRIENEEQKDLVDVLLDIQKENLVGLPIDRVSTRLSACTDTTHTILEWAMTELLRHPRIMTNCTMSDQGDSSLTQKAVIKETLHLPRVDLKSYDKPEEFDPERRGCPGIQFGMAVNEIALANLVHKFERALPGAARA
ncbi:unnamed protein product [Prunus armeniaca]